MAANIDGGEPLATLAGKQIEVLTAVQPPVPGVHDRRGVGGAPVFVLFDCQQRGAVAAWVFTLADERDQLVRHAAAEHAPPKVVDLPPILLHRSLTSKCPRRN